MVIFPFSLFVTGKKNRRLLGVLPPSTSSSLSIFGPFILILGRVGIVFGKCQYYCYYYYY